MICLMKRYHFIVTDNEEQIFILRIFIFSTNLYFHNVARGLKQIRLSVHTDSERKQTKDI